jgi:hypothetical protein
MENPDINLFQTFLKSVRTPKETLDTFADRLTAAAKYLPIRDKLASVTYKYADKERYGSYSEYSEEFLGGNVEYAPGFDSFSRKEIIEDGRKIEGIVSVFKNSELYRSAVNAYRDKDYGLVSELIPHIFESDVENSDILYHGLAPKPYFRDPDCIVFDGQESGWSDPMHPIKIKNYVDNIEKILNGGLKCSSSDVGSCVDENFLAIYCSPNVEYGPAALEIENKGIPTLNGITGESLIYSPSINDFSLVIEPEITKRNLIYKDTPGFLKYRSKTIKELEKRGIPFRVLPEDPIVIEKINEHKEWEAWKNGK